MSRAVIIGSQIYNITVDARNIASASAVMIIHVPPQLPTTIPCRIAFVAEAPSDEELRKRVPLVGRSGRVYNQLLRVAGIERHEVLTTNLFDFKLPDNDVKRICGKTADMKKWRADGYDLPPIGRGNYLIPEFQECLERLAMEIKQARPNVIVPLGGTALWAFTGYTNIMARRGAVTEATMTAPGAKLVPTLHPAAVLRMWNYFIPVAGDFSKAKTESTTPKIDIVPREFWIEPSIRDIWDFYHRHLKDADVISFDIETKRGQIECIAFAPNPHISICIPFTDTRKINNSYWGTADEEHEAVTITKMILQSPTCKLAQNGPYDVQWLYEEWGVAVRNYREDTRLLHHAIYPEMPKGLGFMGAKYARQGPWKTMGSEDTDKRDG